MALGNKLKYTMKSRITLLALLCLAHAISWADGYKPNILDPSYDHDKWQTAPTDIVQRFRAFTVSFDSDDDNDGDGTGDAWGVPEWVAYEIKKFNGDCIPTAARPSPWLTDTNLASRLLAPTDASYAYSEAYRKGHADYDRGHLCMKLIAERLGKDAAYNTHTVLNAVPQWATFNQGIWLDLELLTAAWAQRYGRVWVVTGPIFAEKSPTGFIGETNRHEVRVGVPDALFKIVIKEGGGSTPDVLAFIYPQVGPGYSGKNPDKKYDHTRFLTSVAEIEEFTGLRFLTRLSPAIQKKIKQRPATALWPVKKADFISACQN